MKNTNTKKLKQVLPWIGLLLLICIMVYSYFTPEFLWSYQDGMRILWKKHVFILLFTFVYGVAVLFLPFQKLNEKWQIILGIFLLFATPGVAFLSLEYANVMGPSLIWASRKGWVLERSFISYLTLFLFTGILYILTNRARIGELFICALTAVFTVGNYFTYTFRGIPILASDLSTIGTAMNVAGNYDYVLNYYCVVSLTVLVLWCILLFRVRELTFKKGRKRIKYILGAFVLFFGGLYLIYGTTYMKNNLKVNLNTFRPDKTYKKAGAILTFARSLQLLIIDKPDGYSEKTVAEIAAKYQSDEDSDADVKTPNVIVIMDEAFADLQSVGDFETSEEVMPFYKSLTENTVKGFTYVSVFGGQTANTEFEFLTGMSKAFLPESSTPYQLYIKKTLPGLTTHLVNQGYVSPLAMHPYKGSGYNRNNVYPLLGFSDFITLDDYDTSNCRLIRNFVSDEADFDRIISEYENQKSAGNAPFFMFNVTMQNHSSYDKDFDNFDQPIEIEDEKLSQFTDAKRYLNLIHDSDEALKGLISYFEKTDDPTVIVFFGDHEPGLSDDFYSTLMGKDVETLTDEESMEMYKTPFLIWANYDIEEQTDVNISVNYLSSLMLQSTGMELSNYNKFLLEAKEEIPILTVHGYFGKDGNFYKLTNETSPYAAILNQYNMLQYNSLFDSKDRLADFFD